MTKLEAEKILVDDNESITAKTLARIYLEAFADGVQSIGKKTIKVWVFEDAPTELQALSQHGGDEDWLVLVPAVLDKDWERWEPLWLSKTDTCDAPSRHTLDNGDVVYIGAHA